MKSTCSPAAATKPSPLPVLLQRHRERVRLADLVRRVRRDRDLRVDPRLHGGAGFGATPLVATVNAAEPAAERVEDACPVTFPVEFEVKVIVH